MLTVSFPIAVEVPKVVVVIVPPVAIDREPLPAVAPLTAPKVMVPEDDESRAATAAAARLTGRFIEMSPVVLIPPVVRPSSISPVLVRVSEVRGFVAPTAELMVV